MKRRDSSFIFLSMTRSSSVRRIHFTGLEFFDSPLYFNGMDGMQFILSWQPQFFDKIPTLKRTLVENFR